MWMDLTRIELVASHMRSERSTTELQTRYLADESYSSILRSQGSKFRSWKCVALCSRIALFIISRNADEFFIFQVVHVCILFYFRTTELEGQWEDSNPKWRSV